MPTRRELANAVRALSMDAVQQANSGHPGMPMGMADIAEALWNGHLKHNPINPDWFDRDRFILSNGHGSMLHYALLHLSGYELSMDELRNFRQLHSMTPGHPEYGLAPGVETTTGPLGQGIANGVGMALAEKALASQFNRDGYDIINHHTYVFLGDGCLMEGISHEACSLAGTLGLNKLIAVYDDNGISIDGEVKDWFSDHTPGRFRAYGWHVIEDVDGHDAAAIDAALTEARQSTNKPVLVCCKTVIGWGSPNKAGKASSHGAALGTEEIALVREKLGWTSAPFVVPDDIYAGWDARQRGSHAEAEWQTRFDVYRQQHPELAANLERRMTGVLPAGWEDAVDAIVNGIQDKAETIASRKASQNCLEAFGPLLPELIGGSSDLTGSNLTKWSGSTPFSRDDAGGNYIFYGVREFAMSAINNGIALHGGLLPYGGTFLTFSDYARNAVRLAALMKIRNIFVYTHDSIGLGEDGPTHQSVEHAASLRLIPNLAVWRPCDAVESAVAWRSALENYQTPSCLLFTRQNVPHQERTPDQLADISRGGYVLKECNGRPQLIFIATGSEVGLAMEAALALEAEGHKVRVVSVPCTSLFEAQDTAYRDAVLPPEVTARVAIEAGVTSGWRHYVGASGKVIGIDSFGESAPADVVFEHFGFTVDNTIETARAVLAGG
ncbi:MAG: transketolase [Thiotrichales bacterium]|nr:transketolase [Thiotrichales bacterium]